MLREVLLGIDVGLAVSLFYIFHRLRIERWHLLLLSVTEPAEEALQSIHSFTLNVPPRLRSSGKLKPLGEVLRYGLLIFVAYNVLLATCITAGCV